MANALNVPGFVAAFLADDLESRSLPDAVFRRAGGWEYPAMEARSDDSQLQSEGESIPIALTLLALPAMYAAWFRVKPGTPAFHESAPAGPARSA